MSDGHGGNIYRAASHLGIDEADVIDFSASVNPTPIPEEVLEAIPGMLMRARNYPDPEYRRLVSAISHFCGAKEENIIPGNGASEIIYLLMRASGAKSVIVLSPTFSEYERAARMYGVRVGYHELSAARGFEVDIEALIDDAGEYDCVFICNPNNPTSRLIHRKDLEKLAVWCDTNGKLLVIDEAFIELTKHGSSASMADFVDKVDCLFIIRAFTKIFGLPGIRIGYGIGHSRLILEMLKLKEPWTVGTLNEDICIRLMHSERYLNDTKMWIDSEIDRLYLSLSKIKGLSVLRPDSNYILIRLPESICSGDTRMQLGKRGIVVRNASNFKALNDRYIRVAVRGRAENDILIDAMSEIFNRR